MKKFFEVLLLLPLLLALVFLVFAYRTGALADFFETDTPTATTPVIESATPPGAATLVPYSSSTPFSTETPTSTPSPFFTPTRTRTPTATVTATLPPTQTASSTPTSTPMIEEITAGIATGNQIVQAIERYYVDRGTYPATLSDLVPAYVPALPVTSTGQPYYYRFFSAAHPLAAEGYWLTFRVVQQENTTCTYFRRLLYWDCNSSSP